MRSYIEPIKVTHEIAGNKLVLSFTNSTHVYVCVDNSPLTVKNQFVYKDGRGYYCSGHIWRKDDGTWDYKESSDFYCPNAPSVSRSPRSAYGFIRQAMLDAVAAVLADPANADILLRRAELRDINEDVMRLEEKRAELRAQLDEIDARLVTLQAREDALKAEGTALGQVGL